MGAGVSTDAAPWKSSRAQALDSVGGYNRRAIKRGNSQKMQLEWLGDALVQQEEAIQQALHKDPLAGRHEIMAQETKKAIIQSNLPATSAAGMKLSVKDWQNANHTELRARILQEQHKTQTAALLQAYKGGKAPPVAAPAHRFAGGGPQSREEQEKQAMKQRMRDYYLAMETKKSEVGSAGPAAVGARKGLQVPGSAPSGDQLQSSGYHWREHIAQAKKTAALMLGGMMAFNSVNHQPHKRKGPTRFDSFSFFIANQLGDDTPHYAQDAEKLLSISKGIEQAQEDLEDARHGRLRSRGTSEAASRAVSRQNSDGADREGEEQLPGTAAGTKPAPASSLTGMAAAKTAAYTATTSAAFRPGRAKPSPPSAPAFGPQSMSPRPGTSTGGPRPKATGLRASAPAMPTRSSTTPGAAEPEPSPQDVPSPASRGLKKTMTMAASQDGKGAGAAGARTGSGAAYLAQPSMKHTMAGRKGIAKPSITGHGVVSAASDAQVKATEKLNELVLSADKPRKMMAMRCHRCNTRWAEAQLWEPAPVTMLTRLASQGANGGQVTVFREAAIKALQSGQVALQVFVGEEVVSLSPTHAAYDLWSCDPWEALRVLLPSKAEGVEALSGVALGPRLLLGLATALETIAGADAVSKLHVVIHCSEGQETQVISDLIARHHCGLKAANVLVVTQQSRHGYIWDNEQQTFVSTRDQLRTFRSLKKIATRAARSATASGRLDTTGLNNPDVAAAAAAAAMSRLKASNGIASQPSSAKQPPALGGAFLGGSGYCMMQLGWEGEAQVVNEQGQVSHLPTNVLEYLSSRGVRWLMSRRLRDLALYDPTTTLEPDALAASLWLHESQGATAMVWVDMVASVQAAAAGLQGIVLGRRSMNPASARDGPGSPQSGPGSVSMVRNRSMSSPGATQAARDAVGGKEKALPHGPPPVPVVDLEAAALVSPRMAGVLGEVKAKAQGQGLPASTRRYIWHLPSLASALAAPGALRPVLTVRGAATHVSFDMAQLTGAPHMFAAALSAGPRQTAKMLNTGQDADDLMAAIKSQDASGTFRRLLAASMAAHGGQDANAPPPPPSLSSATDEMLGDPAGLIAREWSGKRVIMLVKDSQATNMALQLVLALLRPGKDMLLLVAVAGSGAGAEAATRATLHKFLLIARGAAVDCAAQMLKKQGLALLDLLEEYVDEADADLVVLGSRGRTSGGAQAMGSLCYGIMKAMPCPVLVVKEAARNADIQWEKDPVRLMVPVDHGSRGMLRWVAAKLLSPQRQDKVLLARPEVPKETDQSIGKRMLQNYSDILFPTNVTGVKKQLAGSYDTAGVKWGDEEKVHIQAIQAPPGRSLPEGVLKLLTNTRSALLLYKGGANEML